jgi:DNA-binding CsgD family transcriptional regulator
VAVSAVSYHRATMSGAVASLPADDVRALMRLAGELRELGDDPPRWRRHLLASLETLCGTRAGLTGEIAVIGDPGGRAGLDVVHHELHGVSPHEEQRFEDEVIWNTHGPNDAISGTWAHYQHKFTASRHQLVDDLVWYQSTVANEHFRPFDCGDFIVSMVPLPALRAMTSIKLFRAWDDPPFTERERLLVELVADELARDWIEPEAAPAGRAMSPRMRQVLALLSAGASEKEVAAALALSTHTVHDYVKQLHRAFGARSRSELLARTARPRRLRTKLVRGGGWDPDGLRPDGGARRSR